MTYTSVRAFASTIFFLEELYNTIVISAYYFLINAHWVVLKTCNYFSLIDRILHLYQFRIFKDVR